MNIHGLRLFNFVHNTVSALESFHSDVDPDPGSKEQNGSESST